MEVIIKDGENSARLVQEKYEFDSVYHLLEI